MTEALAAVVAARLHRARPEPDRGRLPAGERRLAGAARPLRLRPRGRGARLPADRRPLARPRALRQPARRPAWRPAGRNDARSNRPGPTCSSGWPRRSGPTRCVRPSRATSRSRAAASPGRRRRCCCRGPRPRWRAAVRALRRGAGRASCPTPAAPASSAVRSPTAGPMPVVLSFERMTRIRDLDLVDGVLDRRGRLHPRRRAGGGARRRAAVSAVAGLRGLGADRRAARDQRRRRSRCCATATRATSASGSRRCSPTARSSRG